MVSSRLLQIKSSANYFRWEYFKTLFDLDMKLAANARVCPKLTQRHVHLDNPLKMRVCLATQISSNSVAQGLTFYLSHDREGPLKGCEETVQFCKRMHKTFDALNRKMPNQGLTPDSGHRSKDFKVLQNTLDWLNKWEMAVRNGDITADDFLTTETSKALRLALRSTMDMCYYLIDKFEFKYLLTGKINQDNLEKFFGTIRQAGGWNDHPHSPTFLQLYKLLSIYSIIKPPKYGNCTVSEQPSPQMIVSLRDLQTGYGQKSPAKSVKYRTDIKKKLDNILQHDDWDATEVIENNPDHDYTLSPILDCIIYYVTGFYFLLNFFLKLSTISLTYLGICVAY